MIGRFVPPVLAGAATIGLWWLAVVALRIESYVIPAPPAVAAAFARLPGYLLRHAGVTLLETVQGFAITAVGGVALGTLLATAPVVSRAVYPVLVALNAVPKLAFAPLLIIWLGFGPGPKIVMVVLMCFFPVVLATATGLTSTPAELVELARSLAASRWKTFTRVRFPAALPQIMLGLKTAMPLAVIGALVGELFGAGAGLGFVIQNAGADTALAFAAIALLAAMSIALFGLLVTIERRLLPWE
ncbi:ABC transporter permease [Catenuloplanes japonicus]|uniref:ABC transporter permease n=1 Tax=Catenuloplanes japonicus TaxID=33876 RepID=UPI000526D98B|nr:ABC transporter permease [Catenuloplanes japonicus]